MRRFLGVAALLASTQLVAADRHVYLNSNAVGSQLNDCPNPEHNAKGTSNTDEMFYCLLGSSDKKIIGTVSGTATSTQCQDGGGTVQPVINGTIADVDRDGSAETIYGHPQACVYNMAKSDSCEVHAGTYTKAGAECDQNCGNYNYGSGVANQCNDVTCWTASVIAWGFGPNLSASNPGYGTAANPGWLRGAVMNGSTDTWDTNGDKVADAGAYPAIISGDRDADNAFDLTVCDSASCTGDSFHPLIVGCGGGANTPTDKWKANCDTGTPPSGTDFVKIDSDANGTFDTSIDARTLPPVPSPNGPRNVDYFQVKDIEFKRFNGGNGHDIQDLKLRTGSINLNGEGSGFKLDHIYLHDFDYGAVQSIQNENSQAAITDMWNRGCADYTEIKNSYLEQNNRLLFADEGTPAPSLGCSWNIHDNRIYVNVKGNDGSSNNNFPPAIMFMKSIDYHSTDGRPKRVRFWNNEVMFKQFSNLSSNPGKNASLFITEQFGNSGGGAKGELWVYGNLFRAVSGHASTIFRTAFPEFCAANSASMSTQWKVYDFNNTWDGWDITLDMGGQCFSAGSAVGTKFREANNVQVFTCRDNATTCPDDGIAHPHNASTVSRTAIVGVDASKCSGGSRYFVCGTDPVAGSGLAYYTPYTGGGLITGASCDPDGDGLAGVDYDGDSVRDTTWADIAGNTVNCPTTGTAMAYGAIQPSVACTNATCGDGCVGGSETCDDGNTTVAACVYGAPSAQVCDSDCIGNVNCTGPTYCGDGTINGPEACDGSALGGSSCTSLGLGTGTLSCTVGCTFNTSACSVATPGLNSVHGGTVTGGKLP